MSPHLLHQELSHEILGGAIEVHRHLGPGLLESAYRSCLARELVLRGLAIQQEVPIPVSYKELPLEVAYRADMVVEKAVLVELKAVETLTAVHETQVRTYLRLTGLRVGLLLNFNVISLRRGVRRFVL